MKIAIIIRNLRTFGGGERNVFSLIEGLNEKSIVPDVFTEDSATSEEINRRYHKNVSFNYCAIALPKNKVLHFIREIFGTSPIVNQLDQYDFVYDFTNKPPLVSNSSKYLKYIFVLNDKRSATFSKMTYMYTAFTRILADIGIRKFKKFQADIINVTQSEFIQQEINKSTGVTVPIVYPPVAVNEFSCSSDSERSGVVTLGRFSPEKNYFMLVEIAKCFPDVSFTFIGSAQNTRYFNRLKKRISTQRIKNIKLVPDASFDLVNRTLCQSLVFMHSTVEEHFGLSTVEAISAGCIPLVHNSGGQIEIVKRSELLYDDIPDAEIKLQDILTLNREKRLEYLQSLKQNIEKYDERSFQAGMLAYLNL
jgi:glycosyltransferase involved in cell wall biosynthesis